MAKRIVGIDPGVTKGAEGGLALLVEGRIEALRIMPTVTVKGGRQVLDEGELARLYREWSPDLILIELPVAMPGQSPAATGSRFLGCGFLRGLAVGMGIRYDCVYSKTWQKVMHAGLPDGGDTKALSYLACCRMWPGQEWRRSARSEKPHTGLCDAALIAAYASRKGL